MRIAIRTDASVEIGTGHTFRCLALAQTLREKGCEICFICRDLPLNLTGHIISKDYEVHIVSIEGTHEINWEQDAHQTQTILSKKNPPIDWLIIDHYELAAPWEKKMRPFVKKILVIDDLANRSHECNMLLDQTYGENEKRYHGLLPADCHGLFGSFYALLPPAFAATRATITTKEVNTSIPNVHLFFGGTDSGEHTLRYSRLLAHHFPAIRLHIVVGPNFSPVDDLIALQKDYAGRVSWKKNVDDTAKEMAVCDVALGAPGNSTWERACMGLPSAYFAVNVNQVEILQALKQKGFCYFFGLAEQVEDKIFLEKFNDFLNDHDRLNQMRRLTMSAVDGCGAKRVASALFERML